MGAFDQITDWPTKNVAAIIIRDAEIVDTYGDLTSRFDLASVTKLFTAWSALVAIEEGSIALSDVAAPNGATVQHLLSHCSGYPFEGTEPVSSPERKRIYSNTGFEYLADHISNTTGISFDDYLDESVMQAIGADSAELIGSPAKDVQASALDVAKLAIEMQRPTIISTPTLTDAITVQFPTLEGIVPGVGKFNPCPWGLGPEIRGQKTPHWTATRNSSSTFGHFGGAGTFLWVDPVANAACVMLSDLAFDDWGMAYWPTFNDAVLNQLANR